MVTQSINPDGAQAQLATPTRPPYWRASSVLILCGAALLWPVIHAALKCGCLLGCQDAQCDVDSFPLSTFPMFSSNRSHVTLAALRGVDAAGKRVAIPPVLLGTSEVMQARVTVQTAANAGKRASRALCQRVAAEVAAAQLAAAEPTAQPATLRASGESRSLSNPLARVLELELSLDDYDTVAYFTESRAPRHSKVLARCDVVQKNATQDPANRNAAPEEETQ